MIDFIEITAAYSNAVLIAILPQFSEFADRLDLAVPKPISVSHVQRFVPNNQWHDPGGYLTLTNGLEFWFSRGHVVGYRTPQSYFNLQDPSEIPRFFGPLKIREPQAVEIARNSIKRLGFTLAETFADQSPVVDGPVRIGTNIVPHYRFQWTDPVTEMVATTIEVDGSNGVVQEMDLASPYLSRAPPRITVQPASLTPQSALDSASSNRLVRTMLIPISKFSEVLKLPVALPVLPEDVKALYRELGSDRFQVVLKQGFVFDCASNKVVGFTGKDSAFLPDPVLTRAPLANFLGTWKIGEQEATNLVIKALTSLDFKQTNYLATTNPRIERRKGVGDLTIPRFCIEWTYRAPERRDLALIRVAAEVDAQNSTIKALQFHDGFPPGKRPGK